MTIQNWFDENGSYEQGVFLYSQLPKTNKNLLSFFQRKKTRRSASKLHYELQKHKSFEIPVLVSSLIEPLPPVLVPEISHEVLKEKALVVSNKKISPAHLPSELRTVFYQKNKDYYALYELHLQLTDLPDAAEDEALSLIIAIMALRKKVDAAWRDLDFFMEHKKLPPKVGLDLESLTPMGLVTTRQKLYAQRSKRKKTLEKWLKEIECLEDLFKKQRKQARIDRQHIAIEKLNLEINALTNKIDEKS